MARSLADASQTLKRGALVWVAALGAGWLLAFHVLLTTRVGGVTTDARTLQWLYLALVAFAAVAAFVRWWLCRTDRLAWACLALALLTWAGGEIHYGLILADDEVVPFPSIGDGLFLAFYPLCFVAVCLLVRGSAPRLGFTLLLDGFIAATATCSLVASFTLAPALEGVTATGGATALAFHLAYPVGDLILVGALAGGLSLAGGRVSRNLAPIGLGLIIVATADAIHLAQSVSGSYVEGGWVDSLWPAGLLFIASAGWRRADRDVTVVGEGNFGLSLLFSLGAVTVLAVGEFANVDRVPQVLATCAVLGVVARMHIALRDNRRLLDVSRREALADPLTGLANRRQLERDVDAALRRGTDHHLVLFDLDGFKRFNDTFGHLAGDQLLTRRGRALAEGLQPGATAFRLGGDEFCVLVEDRRTDPAAAVACARDALSEHGEGYEVETSWGQVAIPREADVLADALVLADRRMYDRKSVRKRSVADVRLLPAREAAAA